MTSEPEKSQSIGCGILGRYPIISVVSFAAAGIGIGIGLSTWDPEDPDTKSTLLKWIGLVGDVFIRALKAVVLPLVFVNVAVSVVDMMMMGRASSVGVKTIVLYTITTLIASIIGLISILSFQGLFKAGEFMEESTAYIALGCTAESSLLTESMDGSLMCMPDGNLTSPYSQFEIVDLTANLARASGGGLADLSMSDTIYEGVFMKLITDNIFFSFVDGNFAAVSYCSSIMMLRPTLIVFSHSIRLLLPSSGRCLCHCFWCRFGTHDVRQGTRGFVG
jgi:Na+/H+-dicarboxylate symporter